jgi:hypothetical protein
MAFRYAHIRPNLPLAIRAVKGVRSTPIRSPPVTWLATGAAFSDSTQAARQYYSLDLDLAARSFSEPRKKPNCGLPYSRAPAPGETPRDTGAGAERPSGALKTLTPNRRPSSRRASTKQFTKEQGKYWHVARHVHTAQCRPAPSRGGPWPVARGPGGC